MNQSAYLQDKRTNMVNPWDRQSGEPERAFLRFKKYREMGAKRSLRVLAAQEGVQLSSIASISSKFNWQPRVIAWDAHLDKISQQNDIDEICAMKKRQISLALKAQKVAEQGLERLIALIEASDENQERPLLQVRPLDLSKLLDSGCRLERLNRDEPEQNLQITQASKFDNLTVEELETYRNLQAKIDGES